MIHPTRIALSGSNPAPRAPTMAAKPTTQLRPSRPFKYAFTAKEAKHNPPKPSSIPFGKVLIVTGRTQTQVYHTWRDCDKLRGTARIVKETYARAAGLRLCERCGQPHQLTLPTFTPAEVPA